jgi:hypothetical protein
MALPSENGFNCQLTEEYLSSGTYHSVVLAFDPSLSINPRTQKCSFEELEQWFDIFRKQAIKSPLSSLAIVSNARSGEGG